MTPASLYVVENSLKEDIGLLRQFIKDIIDPSVEFTGCKYDLGPWAFE